MRSSRIGLLLLSFSLSAWNRYRQRIVLSENREYHELTMATSLEGERGSSLLLLLLLSGSEVVNVCALAKFINYHTSA